MDGIHAEKSKVRFDLYDKIGQDGADGIRMYRYWINQVKNKNTDGDKEHFIKFPSPRMEYFVSEQEQEKDCTDLINIRKSQYIDNIIKHHSENQSE